MTVYNVVFICKTHNLIYRKLKSIEGKYKIFFISHNNYITLCLTVNIKNVDVLCIWYNIDYVFYVWCDKVFICIFSKNIYSY